MCIIKINPVLFFIWRHLLERNHVFGWIASITCSWSKNFAKNIWTSVAISTWKTCSTQRLSIAHARPFALRLLGRTQCFVVQSLVNHNFTQNSFVRFFCWFCFVVTYTVSYRCLLQYKELLCGPAVVSIRERQPAVSGPQQGCGLQEEREPPIPELEAKLGKKGGRKYQGCLETSLPRSDSWWYPVAQWLGLCAPLQGVWFPPWSGSWGSCVPHSAAST